MGKLIKVASGRGWLLLWPVDLWHKLTTEQQQGVIRAQVDLLERARQPRRRARMKGV